MSSGIFTVSRDQPDDFKGYDYFCVRLCCTCLGFQANIVKEYVLLSALQHIFAGLKRTRDQKLSCGLMSGQLSLASLTTTRSMASASTFLLAFICAQSDTLPSVRSFANLGSSLFAFGSSRARCMTIEVPVFLWRKKCFSACRPYF